MSATSMMQSDRNREKNTAPMISDEAFQWSVIGWIGLASLVGGAVGLLIEVEIAAQSEKNLVRWCVLVISFAILFAFPAGAFAYWQARKRFWVAITGRILVVLGVIGAMLLRLASAFEIRF